MYYFWFDNMKRQINKLRVCSNQFLSFQGLWMKVHFNNPRIRDFFCRRAIRKADARWRKPLSLGLHINACVSLVPEILLWPRQASQNANVWGKRHLILWLLSFAALTLPTWVDPFPPTTQHPNWNAPLQSQSVEALSRLPEVQTSVAVCSRTDMWYTDSEGWFPTDEVTGHPRWRQSPKSALTRDPEGVNFQRARGRSRMA